MFRVRQILGFLDYGKVKLLLPKHSEFDEFRRVNTKKSLPGYAYKYPFNPSRFGLFMEKLVRLAPSSSAEEWDSIVMSTFSELTDAACPFSMSDKIVRNYFYAVYHFAQELTDYADSYVEGELEYSNVVGHPDLVGGHVILDVKTTINFASMLEESLMQIFAYGALAKVLRKQVLFVGVVLPVQKKIVTASLVGWDFMAYLTLLSETAKSLRPECALLMHLHSYKIGSHISKGKSLYQSLRDCGLAVAQVFLSSPQKHEMAKVAESDVTLVATELKMPFFVHAPYYLNIAKETSDQFQLKVMKHEFGLATRMKARGVVIHLGSHSEEATGLEMAKKTVATLLTYASPETPLLLETQAGEGADIIVSLEELVEFYNFFQDKSRLKLCIDLAHIWAVGYNPYIYLTQIIQLVGSESIALVHFNDSECHRGSRKDRHALYGRGYIGPIAMGMSFVLCNEHNIFMVTE